MTQSLNVVDYFINPAARCPGLQIILAFKIIRFYLEPEQILFSIAGKVCAGI